MSLKQKMRQNNEKMGEDNFKISPYELCYEKNNTVKC